MRQSLIPLGAAGRRSSLSAWKLEAEIEAVRAASPAHPEEIELVTLTQSNVVNRTGATAPDWQTGEEAAALVAVRLHAHAFSLGVNTNFSSCFRVNLSLMQLHKPCGS